MPDNAPPALADPPLAADERATLGDFLDFYRAILLRKGHGMTPDQLDTALPPTDLTLGRLIRHMTMVESHWFEQIFAGRPEPEPWASADWDSDRDWEMTTAKGMSFDVLRADFDRACQLSRSILADVVSLDELAAVEDHARRVSMRWVLVHMVEEYARHCGHADLIAQAIDGRVGD